MRSLKCVPCLVTAALILCTNLVVGEDPIEIVSVEETWEMNVGEPNTIRNAPQVTMVMSPREGLGAEYFVLVLNHRTEPSYSVGGIQVQQWNDEQFVDYRNGPSGNQLHHAGETVTWTQRMSVSGGAVTYEVINGTSQSWGNFGGQGYLTKTVATGQANLNTYDPVVSINESGIGFGGNRVASLTLKQIRWTLSDGRVYEAKAPINIDTDLDPWEE